MGQTVFLISVWMLVWFITQKSC